MPTAAASTYSASCVMPFHSPHLAKKIVAPMGASLDLAAGTVMGVVTATGKWVAYDESGTDDGRRVARGILKYPIITDASGNVTLSDVASTPSMDFGLELSGAEIWISGTFKVADLTGLDANGVADLGRIIYGDTTDGLLEMS